MAGEEEDAEGHGLSGAVTWPESAYVCVCVSCISSPLCVCVSERIFLIFADEAGASKCLLVCVNLFVCVHEEIERVCGR